MTLKIVFQVIVLGIKLKLKFIKDKRIQQKQNKKNIFLAITLLGHWIRS